MKKVILATVILATIIAVPISAQDRDSQQVVVSHDDHPILTAASYAVMVSGNVADIWTTKQAFSRGAVEANPFGAGMGFAGLTASKASWTLAMAMTMKLLMKRGHPKAARIIGLVDGAITWGVAAHNNHVRRY